MLSFTEVLSPFIAACPISRQPARLGEETRSICFTKSSWCEQAAAQAVGALKSEIATVVTDSIVKAAVKEALTGDSVKAMLVKIAERWSADEALVISTAEADALKAYFAKNAKALLDKGVEIKQVNGLKTLFSVAPADGSYKVNFGEGEFEAFFKSFLRPQMVELLF